MYSIPLLYHTSRVLTHSAPFTPKIIERRDPRAPPDQIQPAGESVPHGRSASRRPAQRNALAYTRCSPVLYGDP
jgi:hypothetical protein